ncbi:dihydrolipoamide acetyltransferase family protein [Eilatimonas milleporae]|uniref:Dihydrolipoamide acetyltransferase component of pyruvate dehydrogenase complex n=1 Tax=Eilatimonas milleporae TaxID=911205 RepID=A0A3M0CEV8_9PROT|nr:dihydrolipoamide acetyltransferase family protein [Eilatimonas milleporae]RMB07932.1 branched-chain alpha-keto acid dehydrogenase E2 component [Eilatimonas milleporae]
MGEHVIKMPDIGEGVAEAELVEWNVAIGAQVREDEVLASVMTDKATVEIPSPRDGKILWFGADVGDTVAVGAPIIRLEVAGEGNVKPGEALEDMPAPEKPEEKAPEKSLEKPSEKPSGAAKPAPAPTPRPKPAPAPAAIMPAAVPRRAPGEKPLAAPSVRKRAMDAGVDLRHVPGTGGAGRITHGDLDAFIASGGETAAPARTGHVADTSVTEIKVVGLRRKIAEQMATAKSRIPHITYVDEVDVTALEDLRARLNSDRKEGQPKLTLLPFLMRAMVRAIGEQPQMNARFDDEAGVIHRYGGMHMGVAAQTGGGLVVPVVRHAEALGLWATAAELSRLAEAARAGTATREELTGSTITITSLGKMGGIVTTPVINYPEVAIIGVNKIRTLPVWQDGEFVPRKMMNLSSSFDHRVIDGWDAAVFIQRIKGLLESPATIFIED